MPYFINPPEILSPAGNPEKLRAAIRFGADAIYLAGREFGMRTAADNFSLHELADAAEYVHARGRRLYLTVNTMPHGGEYPRLAEFLRSVSGMGIDGFIVADLGVLSLLREIIPDAKIHISTQAGIVSPAAAAAYVALGACRLVLARELTLDEIAAIRAALPDGVELEAFVHGSMCVSYSGRCMLSNALTGRDANRGNCAQPCRWNYTLMEEKRPDMRIPVGETPLGTFVMSSKDMCLINHVAALAGAGITSFKIEGRVKSAYYTAVVTNAYRMAVDGLMSAANPAEYVPSPDLYAELCSVSHREYCTGFFFSPPSDNPQLVTRAGYVREKAYLALAAGEPENAPDGVPCGAPDGAPDILRQKGIYRFIQRNKVCRGDLCELLTPGRCGQPFVMNEIFSPEGEPINATPHPSMEYYARVPYPVREGDIIRAGGTNNPEESDNV